MLLLGVLASQVPPGPSVYFLSTITRASSRDITFNGIDLDSSDNIYAAGVWTGGFASKFDSVGTIGWQNNLTTNDIVTFTGVASDLTGTTYYSGHNSLSSNFDLQIAKYNSSGVVQWQREIGSASTTERGNGIAIDSAGNAYIVGGDQFGSPSNAYIAKYNSSGTIQWQKSLNSADAEYFAAITIDSSDNIYCLGVTADDYLIVKYNTSGVVQWQRKLAVTDALPHSIACDSTGNVYCAGRSQASSIYAPELFKYNSSGTLQWQKRLSGGFGSTSAVVGIDSADNVYLAGGDQTTSGDTEAFIAKYNSSGTIQWQRKFATSVGVNPVSQIRSIKTNSVDDIVFGGAIGNQSFLGRVPNTGGKTGNFTLETYTVGYAASSMTDSTPTYTSSTTTLTEATSTLTDQATTHTQTTSSGVVTTISI